MKMFRFANLAMACLPWLTGVASASDLSDIAGEWRTVRHSAEVKITDCGDGSPCGFLHSVPPEISRGHTRDVNNHDPNLRDRPLDSLPILWGYARGESGWRKGRLYNPETGQTFRSSLDLLAHDQLRVTGCMGPFCRQQIWIRINEAGKAEPEGPDHD